MTQRKSLLLAAVWLAPLGILAGSAALGRPVAPFQPLFALAVWLLVGYVGLAAAWFARGSDVRVAGRPLRAFAAPLAVLGTAPFLAALGFADVVRVGGVASYDLGHSFWLLLDAGALVLFGAAWARPSLLARPMRVAAVSCAALAAAAVAAAPLGSFMTAEGGVTALYNAAFAGLAAATFALAAAVLRAWLRAGHRATLLVGTALVLLGYSMLGFLLQQSAAEMVPAWFGRFAALAAVALFLAPAIAAGPAGTAEATGAEAPRAH